MFLTHAHKPKFWLNLRIYFDLSLSLSFFLCLSCLLAVCSLCRLFLHGIVAGQLFRKGKNLFFKEQQINSDIGSGFFLKMLPFCECNVVRISLNLQNEISLETFGTLLLTNLLTYINWKLNGSRTENMQDHASFHMEW